MRALSFSAQAAGEEDEQMTKKEIALTILFALVLASVLFIVIPTGAAHLAAAYTNDPIVFNLIEGGDPSRGIPSLYLGYLMDGRDPPRLSVPRRRAQKRSTATRPARR